MPIYKVSLVSYTHFAFIMLSSWDKHSRAGWLSIVKPEMRFCLLHSVESWHWEMKGIFLFIVRTHSAHIRRQCWSLYQDADGSMQCIRVTQGPEGCPCHCLTACRFSLNKQPSLTFSTWLMTPGKTHLHPCWWNGLVEFLSLPYHRSKIAATSETLRANHFKPFWIARIACAAFVTFVRPLTTPSAPPRHRMWSSLAQLLTLGLVFHELAELKREVHSGASP